MISFHPTNFGARECKAWKYSRINDAGEYNLFRIFAILAARHFFFGAMALKKAAAYLRRATRHERAIWLAACPGCGGYRNSGVTLKYLACSISA